MRLAACVPHIPAQLVSSLEKCGIRTEADLLFSGSIRDIFRRLPAGTTTLSELAEVTALVAKLTSVAGHSAAELMEASGSNEDYFLSGLPRLDKLLQGLSTTCRLIEVSGDKGSGKTSFLLYLVLRHLVERPQSGVLWIDTTGDFSAVRAGEILEVFDGPGASTALERLQISLAFEVDAVHQVLEDLRLSLTSNHPPDVKIRGIVVDTVTSLFSPILSPISSQGHAIMTGFMRQLRAFAQGFSVSVFIVNNSTAFTPFIPGATSNNPNIRKPALGPSFTFLTDATFWLALCREDSDPPETHTGNECTKHIAQLYRSKMTASKALCAFKIRQGILLPCEEDQGSI